MSTRFQFSLGRLVGSLSLFCLAVGLWRQAFPDSDFSSLSFNPFAFMGFVISLAAGVGILFGKALDCAFAAYLGFVLLTFVALLKLWLG